jgi:uncharacterized membrane protein SpoIIM required for sporulation
MIEMLINPKKAEREPWEMFFIGLLYGSVSLLIVDWIFLRDSILAQYTSMLIVTFATILSIPFMYFLIKFEEEKESMINKEIILIKEHGKAITALVYLFLGFIVAFSFWYMVLPSQTTASNFKAQIEQYCAINMPYNFGKCVTQHGVVNTITGKITAEATSRVSHFLNILVNNIYVLIFILIFSLAFGAGAIFILAWNASVIAAATGIFAEASLKNIHLGLMRYMIHGMPELIAYFIGALAGGMLSIAIIRHEFGHDRFWHILRDSVDLIILAVVVLIIAGLIEIFITPALF